MSSPRLGVVRESMLSNPLLLPAPLGRSRTLPGLPGPDPGPGSRVGAGSSLREGGVAEVLSSWKVQSRREDPARRPDFVSLNRDAVRSGLVTSKELSQYRAQRGGATAQSSAHKQQQEGGTSVPDITFGVRNRAPSPLSELLSHRYGRRWMELQLSRNQTSNQTHKVKAGCVAETRTSLLRRSRALPVSQEAFTLQEYTQVAPALDTFRDPGARLRALRAVQGGPGSSRGADGD